MTRQELINEIIGKQPVIYSHMFPYRRSIYTYIKHYFCCEPLAVVHSLTNNSCLLSIEPVDDFSFHELALKYVNQGETPEDADDMALTVSANSCFMKKLI
jgi:hypothetical protein